MSNIHAIKSLQITGTPIPRVAKSARLWGILATTNGVSDSQIYLYDNASAASGTELANLAVPAANLTGARMFQIPVAAKNGIFPSIFLTGEYWIYYED